MKKEKNKKKKFKVAKTSFYWLYFVCGVVCILSSIFFAPFWVHFGFNESTNKYNIPWASFYTYALAAILSALILVYVFTILLKRIKQKNIIKRIRIIFALEFSLMIVIAFVLLLKAIFYNNENFFFFNTLELLAIIMWIRGFVEIIHAYYYDRKTLSNYPLWFLLINIALLSAGPVLFYIGVKNNDVDLYVSYTICALLLFFGSFLCICGVLAKPIKVIEEPVSEDNVLIDNPKDVKEISNNDTILIENNVIDDKKE